MGKENRSEQRDKAFIALYADTYCHDIDDTVQSLSETDEAYAPGKFARALLAAYARHSDEVDAAIKARLKGWRLERLSRVSLAVLRLAVTEMLFVNPGFESVVINEAVEISKRYGDEKDYQFINGVLGHLARSKGEATPPEEEAPWDIPATDGTE